MSNRELRSGSSADVDQRMFSCDTCGEKFWIKSKLDKHRLSHAETVFSCYSCDESFSSYSELDLHSRSHKRTDQSNQCLHCKTQFADRSELLYHVHITHPEHSIADKPKSIHLEKNVTNVPATFKNESQTCALPKIVQVGTLSGNSKIDGNPIIYGVVRNFPSPPKTNNSSLRIKPILKSSDAITIKKINRPLSWKDPIDVDSKHHQPAETALSVKRISDSSQKSPRKHLKGNHFTNFKQSTVANNAVVGPRVSQNQPLRLLASTPKSVTTTVIRVGETSLSPITVKENVPVKKQVANLVNVSRSTLPKQLNPSKGLTVAEVHNVPDKIMGIKGSPNISINPVKTTSSPKIIINLPQQGGLIQPGQQLISANLFAGKTFIIQKSPNSASKGSGNKVGSQGQFLKQRVLINPVPSPKPPVQLAAVQPVVLASPVKKQLSFPKPPLDNSTISKSTVAQNTAMASSAVNSETTKGTFKNSPQTKKGDPHKAESPHSSVEKASLSVDTSLPQTQTKRVDPHKVESPHSSLEKASLSVDTSLPQNPLIRRGNSSTRGGLCGKKYSSKKTKSGNMCKNEKYVNKLTQAKIKFSPNKMNSIDLENLTSLKVVLPTLSLKKLPDSVYDECIRNGFINMKNLNKKFLVASKKAPKMKSKNAIEVNPISTDDEIQNVKANKSNIVSKEKVSTRSTRIAAKEDSDIEIHSVNMSENTGTQNLKAVENVGSLNVQDVNKEGSKQNVGMESVILPKRKTRNSKTTNQGLLNRHSRDIQSDGLNLNTDDNLSTPTLKKTKQSFNVTTPVSTKMKTKETFSVKNKTAVSPTKRYPKRGVNTKEVNQILPTGQVQNMKTCDIVPAQNVKTNELNSTQKGIENSSRLANNTATPSPSSVKVQIAKAAKNVKKNELNFVNDNIASSPALANNTLKSTLAKKVEQIMSAGQVQNMKTFEKTPLQSSKTSDIVPAQNVKTSKLNSTPKGVANPSGIANSTAIPSPPNATVQIMKGSGNNKIASSPAPANSTLKSTPSSSVAPSNVKVVPVTADFMKKLKQSLLKSTPCADSNNIRVVVPSEVLSKIQASGTITVSNTNITTGPECAAPPIDTNIGVVPLEVVSKSQVPGMQIASETRNPTGPERASSSVVTNIGVAPAKVANKIQVKGMQTVSKTLVTTGPERAAPSVIAPVTVPYVRPSKSIIKNYENVDEMLEEDKKKREEKEKVKKKEKILKKMLLKFEEKEERKQVKYFQKKLFRFIEKNRAHLLGSEQKLFEVISNSSKILEELKGLKHASETEIMNQLVTNVMLKSLINDSSPEKSVDEAVVRREQQKKSVRGFVNVSTSRAQKKGDSNSASHREKNVSLKQSPVPPNPKSHRNFSSALHSDNVYVYDAANETSMEDKADQASYSKSSNFRKNLRKRSSTQKPVIKPFQEDPFTDLSIITGEKFTIECPCQNENCDGLHPELSFF